MKSLFPQMVIVGFLFINLLYVNCRETQTKGIHELEKLNWTSLFNGNNLDGWHIKCTPTDKIKTYFSVIDGAIEANSAGDTNHNYVWLMSNKSFDNFAFRLEFKIFKDFTGNTGVQFRSRYNDSISWLDGPQVDICVDPLWRTGMIWDETRGNKRWLYPDLPKGDWVNKSMANPGLRVLAPKKKNTWGKWNQMIVVAKGTNVKVYVNNKLVTNYAGDGVLNSENHQKFGVGMNGQFALQIHNKDEVKVRFRNIEVVELE